MMPDIPEERMFSTGLELRDAQAVGVGGRYNFLEGRAVPYDVWADISWFMECHAPGSFKRSTNGRSGQKLPLLLMHDNRSLSAIVGHADEWHHRQDGMHGVWRLTDSAEAQTAARMAEAGDLVGMSIGFADAAAPEWEFPRDFDPDLGPDHKARVTRVESRLLEVSLTPTPAFVDAEVTMVRTRAARPEPPRRQVDRWREILEELRSGSDDRG